jgi:thioredoxin-like negative regulator of GroEL
MQSVVQDKSDSIVVVVFTDASEASTSLLSMVEKAATKTGSGVKFFKVEMSLVSAAATKLGVETAPVTVLWKGGVKGKTMTGTYGGPELKTAIEELRAQ